MQLSHYVAKLPPIQVQHDEWQFKHLFPQFGPSDGYVPLGQVAEHVSSGVKYFPLPQDKQSFG